MVYSTMRIRTGSCLVALAILAAPEGTGASTDGCGACGEGLCAHAQITASSPASRLAEQAPLLFVGTVVRAETLETCDRIANVTFRVKKAWKGVGLERLTIQTGGACAHPFPFAIGREYLVAAETAAGTTATLGLYCGFSPVEASAAQGWIQALDDWRRAQADAARSQEP